jgi:chromosome segregation ATPase
LVATCLLAFVSGSAQCGSRENVQFDVPACEAERIRQWHALEQERDRADRLARELASVRAELNAARLDREHAIGAIEMGIRQTQALELERDRVSNLARDLSFVKAELDAARTAAAKAKQVSSAALKQDPLVERGDASENAPDDVAHLQSDLALARNTATKAMVALAAEKAQRQALERDLKQQRNKADALVAELASLKTKFETGRTAATEASNAAAAEASQKQDIERELKLQRDRADAAVAELSELRTASTAQAEAAAKATAAESERKLALESKLAQQRDRADAAVKQLASVQATLDAARAASAAARPAEAAQRQKLEHELGEQREKADALARETLSLRNERDDARSAAREALHAADAAKAEGNKELISERGRSEALVQQLAAARKEIGERSAGLAAAYAEILRVTGINATAADQKKTLDGDRERTDELARELVSVRAQLEEANGKLAATNAFIGRLPEQAERTSAADPASDGNATASSGRETARAVLTAPQRPSRAGASVSEAQATENIGPAASGSNVVATSEGPAPSGAAPHAVADEQRLLARANALLRQADISSARQLLELALARGSARAAFMLAETYDPPVLKSWRASGVAGDPTKARSLYQKAKAGGIDDAEARIKALK